MDATDIVMPLGQHKGQRLSEIPVEYLDWLIGEHWLRPALKRAIEEHLMGRRGWHLLGDED